MTVENPQAQRLYSSLVKQVGEGEAESIMNTLPLSKAPSDKRKIEWARSACAALDEKLDIETAESVRKGCHCSPPQGEVNRLKKLWEESDGVQSFADKMNKLSGAFAIETDGDSLIQVYPRCYCSFVKRADKPLPALWCACTLGYAEAMFSAVTGRQVKATLLESVVTGGERCRIKVSFSS